MSESEKVVNLEEVKLEGRASNDNDANRDAETPSTAERGEAAEKKGTSTDIAEKLRELSKERTVRKTLFSVVEKIDDNAVINKIRKHWNDLPHAAQWAALNLPVLGIAYSEALKLLVKLGVLEYKGAMTEQAMKEMSEWEKIKLEWGVKIGSIFVPELKAVMPEVEAALKIKDIQDEVFTDARYHLKELRVKKEDAKKIAKIKDSLLHKSAPQEEMAAAA